MRVRRSPLGYVLQHSDLSSLRPALDEPQSSGLTAALLPRQCCKCGRAICSHKGCTEKIGHRCQDMGEPAQDQSSRSQGAGCTGSTSQDAVKDVLRLPGIVNRWQLFASLYISIQMNPTCAAFISSGYPYNPTLAQSPSDVRSHPSQPVTAAHRRRTAAVSRWFWALHYQS